MGTWLSKTSNVFQRETPEEPQPYRVTCGCGESYEGVREPHSQRVVCSVCGTELFVLPRDVYPPPQPSKKRTEPAVESIETVEILDEPTPVKQKSRKKASKSTSRSASPTEQSSAEEKELPSLAQLRQRMKDAAKPRMVQTAPSAPTSEPGWLQRRGTAVVQQSVALWRGFRGFWTPFRLIALTVLVFFVFTGSWLLRQAMLARAAGTSKQEIELGLAAIEQQDWVKAREHLAPAVLALDRLGRTDPEARTVRQYLREADTLFRLCPVTIEELLSKARSELDSRGKDDPSTGGLALAHQGDWLVFEAEVTDISPEKSRSREFAIRLPEKLQGDEQSPLIRVDFPLFDRLIPQGESRWFILAGAIANCRRNDADNGWVIDLNPRTGFLWGHLDTYRALGFEFNPLRAEAAVKSELAEQARTMGTLP